MENHRPVPSLLKEAYEHYEATGDRRFTTYPRNESYLTGILSNIPSLLEEGYVENLSDNLQYALNNSVATFQIASQPESLSFDITAAGIEYVRRSF